jgi:acetyl esterase/lipase
MKRVLKWLGIATGSLLLLAGTARLYLTRSATPGSLEHPRGYSHPKEILAAIATGGLKLIDMNPPLPANVVERTNVEYGRIGSRALDLDLYTPAGLTGAVPGLVFIHGGAWRTGKRQDYRIFTTHFAAQGYVAATASYRLFREAPFPAAVEDVKCAVRWMRAHAAELHVDPERIAVIGGSAGGHLSMMVGYSPGLFDAGGGNTNVDSHVAAVVDIYGPADLTTPFGQKAAVVKDFLGGRGFDGAPDLWRSASPQFHLKAGAPPTLILQGTLDEIVPVGQSDTLAARLVELGVPYEYERLAGWPHAMDACVPVNEYFKARIGAFLAKRLGR